MSLQGRALLLSHVFRLLCNCKQGAKWHFFQTTRNCVTCILTVRVFKCCTENKEEISDIFLLVVIVDFQDSWMSS
jgi:hypothetical protein